MRKLALLAIATVSFVSCQGKTAEAPKTDTTAVVAAPVDTAKDTTKVDSAKVDTAKKDTAKKAK
ncbi:MAG: hypothetical protein AAB214_13690 [Fibrobacterota bacterium]